MPVHNGRLPARQKSMIDLRDPLWDQQRMQQQMLHHRQLQQQQHMSQRGGLFGGQSPQNMQPMPPHHQQHQHHHTRPPMVRSATEHDIKVRNRRSMAVGPFEDLPPHIRQHMVRQHGFRFGEENLFGSNGNRRPMGGPQQPPSTRELPKEDAFMMRQLTLDAQREFLVRRGFSPSHPYISGEVPIHPELQGRLPFNVPSRTIPLRPDDYQRFKPELWLQNHNPTNPVAFTDLAVLHSELELRRRREVHRQNSQRQHQRPLGDGQENNFNSLPWEEIIPRRNGGVPVLPPEHELREQREQLRSRSQDNRRNKGPTGSRPFSLLSGAGWFNQGWREGEARGSNVKEQGHWLLREKDAMQSMPPIGTLRDSGIGIGDDGPLSRNDANRSSFGMALKDKFAKNPNMYFPGGDPSEGSSRRATSSNGSGRNGDKRRNSSTATSPTKTNTTLEEDLLSDTDTLIHNMSEGSFEKESLNGHDSLGSAKGSRSSGNSSLSPHNSMEGSPRMIGTTPQFQPVVPSSAPTASNPSVSLGKKTIRNYTPKESSNMLREFEDRRNNSVDWRNNKNKKKQETTTTTTTTTTVVEQNQESLERKSSMERLIDDFHRSLPPPPSDGRQQQPLTTGTLHDSTLTTSATAASSKRPSKHGTLNSQISNWSAASSAASFDYQPAANGHSHSSSYKRKSSNEQQLPALAEVEYTSRDENIHKNPRGERIPPEGAPAQDKLSPQPPFVQRIEVKAEVNAPPKPKKRSPSPQKKQKPARKVAAKDQVADLLVPPPEGESDDFSNLRKLISEGRIAGLNEKPPSFVPPTPPTVIKKVAGVERAASSSTRPKPPAPTTPKDTPKSSRSAERQPSRSSAPGDRPRKSREAPRPPGAQSTSSTPPLVSSDVKFLSSRHRESMEDLTQMEGRRRVEVKRSSSNHGIRPAGLEGLDDHHTAQLIADSTEKKFNFNPFKGMWKKKHYSFDFN